MTDNNLVTKGVGYLSDQNSTSAALATLATFTGKGVDCSSFPSVVVACKTDQDGSLYVDFSPDNENWDSTLTFPVTASLNEVHRITTTRPYCRVRFYNSSASNQTYLRLSTMFGHQSVLNSALNSTAQQDSDAIMVRPVSYEDDVALGRRTGITLWNKFGYNSDIDIGTETIWAPGGTFTRLTAASTLTLVSSSANDDGSPAGTGARSVIVYGIDANYIYQTEVVTLDGTTPVVTSTTWLGINRVAVYLAGSLGYNDGAITVTATTGGSTQALVPATEGTTQQCFFFVQAGHTALMDWLYITLVKNAGGTQPKVTIKAFVTSLVSGARYEVFRDYLNGTVENHTELNPSDPFVVGEKSVIVFQATTDVDNTEISLRFTLKEVKNA